VSVQASAREDGRVNVDFTPPAGPFITVTLAQWRELVALIKQTGGRL
jgi:hypothetical protein